MKIMPLHKRSMTSFRLASDVGSYVEVYSFDITIIRLCEHNLIRNSRFLDFSAELSTPELK
ncbi:unnamed protein product [Candida parapsilosis]